MAVRSTSSEYQPSPPNYVQGATGVWHNIGHYRAVTSTPTTQTPVSANMCTSPVCSVTHRQFQYIPRING